MDEKYEPIVPPELLAKAYAMAVKCVLSEEEKKLHKEAIEAFIKRSTDRNGFVEGLRSLDGTVVELSLFD